MDRIQDIRSRYFREGQSIRQIARELGMSRRTVSRYIQSDGPWRYTLREPRPRPVADAIEPIVREIIENDQRVRNRKQRHTTRRIYVRLVEEHGYRGSERTVRRLVAAIKQEIGARSKEVFLPLEFEYGQAFEADWLEVVVEMGGRLVPVNVFAARLRASRASFVKAYPTTRQEALFDGLQGAFHFWDGVPETGRFDNPRTVARIIKRGTREENERFAQFRAHYGFKLSLCTPGEGHEKGSVENFAGFVQRGVKVQNSFRLVALASGASARKRIVWGVQDMEGGSRAANFAGVLAGPPWAPADGRCCGKPLDVSEAEPVPPGYWEDESVRRRCILECGACGKRYLGWYD